jgi:DNA-binding beta-propeller fold protein YncE
MSEMVIREEGAAPAATEDRAGDRLERWLGRPVHVNWEVVAWVALVVVAAALRLWFLGNRAMSHDESLHVFYSWRLFNGEGYVHDPMMHGPLLYHVTALIYFLFGVSDFTARLMTVFLGMGLVMTPLLLRRYLGPVGAWVTGAILVISPTVLYYTRYIRHDIHVEFFIVLLFVALFRFLDTRRGGWLVAAGAAAAGAITSAEMSYIMGFVLVLYVVMALVAERLGRRWADVLAITLGVVGLGLLIFGVFAHSGQLGSAEKGTTLHSIMHLGFAFGGIFVALSLGIGLLTRFATAPVVFAERTGNVVRDIMAQHYFAPDGPGRPAVLAVSGAVVVAFSYALTTFLFSALGRSVACSPGSADARCVLTGVLGIGLPALGFTLLLLAVAGAFIRMSPKRGSVWTLGAGVVLTLLGLALFWVQHAQTKDASGAVGAYLAPEWARATPLVYVASGFLVAAGLLALYGLFSWLLENDEERGLAEALASAPTWALTLAVVAFVVVYVLLFTTFFSNPKGIYGFWDSVKYWVEQQDVVRGDQPWYYYILFDPMYEFLPFLLAVAGMLLYSLRPAWRVARGNDLGTLENPEPGARIFVPMLITWAVGVFWLFSWAGEKMPWLIVHLVVPQAFLAGRLVSDLSARVDWAAFRARGWQLAGLLALLVLSAGATLLPFAMGDMQTALQSSLPVLGIIVVAVLVYGVVVLWRKLGSRQAWLVASLTVVAVVALLNVRVSLAANYVNDQLAKEYIVYAHGTPEDKMVYNLLRDLQTRLGVDKPLKIIYDDDVSWPFTWYFRNSDWSEASYVGKKPSGGVNADVALVGSANYSNFEPYLGKRYVSIEYPRMWWPNEGYKGLTMDRLKSAILDPKDRRNWLNILLFRRYTKDPQADVPEPKLLSDWYHHSNMRLYIRKDMLDKAWPLLQARPEWVRNVQTSVAQEVPELKLAKDVVYESPVAGKPITAPKDIALGPGGDLYVVDQGNYRVVVYGPDGKFKAVVGDGLFVKPPDAQDPSQQPSAWGVGVAPDGSVYVADTWLHRIVKFGPDGTKVGEWGTFGNPEDKTTQPTSFYGPRDVAISATGDVYVTDTGNSRILVFDADGKPLRTIVDAGSELGAFNEPTSLAFDPATGEMYVADLWNKRVVRFKADGSPDTAWEVDGWDSQEAAHKAYIAVGPGGVVVFSDPSAQRVWLYSREGKALGTLDLPMDEQGLDQPIGVAVDDQGRVHVAASNSGVITRYAAADVITQAASQPPAPAESGGQGAAAQPTAQAPQPTVALQPSPTAYQPPAGAAGPQPSATGQAPGPNPRPGKP